MTPTGVAFAAFTLAVLLLYWLGPRQRAWQNGVLLLASAVFYLSWSPRWLGLLAVTTGLDFWAAQRMRRPGLSESGQRAAFALAVVGNLAVLIWFKYAGFLIDAARIALATVGVEVGTVALSLSLPIGLSYYTLIRIGYLLDVRHGRIEPERSLLNFATFVWFFPQLVAGPITRARSMLPQFAAARRWGDLNLGAAAAALLLGWTLKGYVADWAGPALVDPVFADPAAFAVAAHWLAISGYAMQVFGDFAGYSLLAIGVALLFGVALPANFDRPFLSRSMPEFWRRWHISLNTWLFDYVFSPLTTGGGRLHGRIATNLIVVFMLSGIWHGARWTFVLWGLLHGLALALHEAWDGWYRAQCRRDRRWVTARKSWPYGFVAWVLTQGWFLASLILFRSANLSAAGQFARGLIDASGARIQGLDTVGLASLAGAVVLLAWHHVEGLSWGGQLRTRLHALPAATLGMLVGLGICWLLVFAPLARTSFIYAQF